MKVLAMRQGVDATPRGLSQMIETVGTSRFAAHLVRSFTDLCDAAYVAVYQLDVPSGRTSLILGGGAAGNTDAGEVVAANGKRYAERHARSDPACRVVFDASSGGAITPLATHLVRDELSDGPHRLMLEQEGVPDRIALFFPLGHRWTSLHVMRRKTRQGFTDAEFARMGGLASVYGSLLARHLCRNTDCAASMAITELRDQLCRLDAGLSQREGEICIGLLLGRSTNDIARSLGITAFSAQTYRKRAYLKLGVTTQHQLFLLLMGYRIPPAGDEVR